MSRSSELLRLPCACAPDVPAVPPKDGRFIAAACAGLSCPMQSRDGATPPHCTRHHTRWPNGDVQETCAWGRCVLASLIARAREYGQQAGIHIEDRVSADVSDQRDTAYGLHSSVSRS
ncbi:hypothetical protein AcW1_000778 [Taiwanofungus camphoratus]|nr:hypothetical protein AcV7_000799 [Antrodia cinnamomea]KAI0963805.1 hypothetical protein AcW1_000778 [Antrodia cinnamomea]